jgi:GT2 family glycosyltransferase
MTSIAVVTPWLNHTELWPSYRMVVAECRADDEVIVVDNGSDPPLDFATLRVDVNLGFCGGSNAGLRAATTDAVLFLNNDVMRPTSGEWLNRIRDAVEPGVLVGPVLRGDAHTRVNGWTVPYLDGWCLAGMREDLLDLGGFNERLTEPAYYSDNLLCLEARAAGMELLEVPIGLRHLENITAAANPDLAREAGYANREIYQRRARQLFKSPATIKARKGAPCPST